MNIENQKIVGDMEILMSPGIVLDILGKAINDFESQNGNKPQTVYLTRNMCLAIEGYAKKRGKDIRKLNKVMGMDPVLFSENFKLE